MWFRFPDGVDQISVEQQLFRAEATGEDGSRLFRAPDHFAPIILELGGFSKAAQPPDGPPDLIPENPVSSLALERLAEQVEALLEENQRLRYQVSDLQAEKEVLLRQISPPEAEVPVNPKAKRS